MANLTEGRQSRGSWFRIYMVSKCQNILLEGTLYLETVCRDTKIEIKQRKLDRDREIVIHYMYVSPPN